MLTQRTLSFFGQALNNTSEQSEVSLFCVVIISIDFSPFGRRPLVRFAHRKLRLSESKESLLALPSGSSFVKQNIFNFYIKEWSGMTNSRIMSTLGQHLYYYFYF